MPVNTLFPSATTVANMRRLPKWWSTDDHFVYIGREQEEMHYGNPFSWKSGSLTEATVNTREESIEECRKWLSREAHQDLEPERREWILVNLHMLRGKTLVCYCKQPTRFVSCHGDILAELADTT